ncbi:MAG: hypothetical protein ACI8WB_001510 [Phenylobacterium sp.]|jgi:hypothetical protein
MVIYSNKHNHQDNNQDNRKTRSIHSKSGPSTPHLFKSGYPKIIYEAFPYFHMTLGIVAISHFQTLLTSFSGVCFFAAGAVMWVLRSDNRRKDQIFKRKHDGGNWRELYELKPFLYILAGVLFSSWSQVMLVDMLGVGVAMVGVFQLMRRVIYRRT